MSLSMNGRVGLDWAVRAEPGACPARLAHQRADHSGYRGVPAYERGTAACLIQYSMYVSRGARVRVPCAYCSSQIALYPLFDSADFFFFYFDAEFLFT